jgi:hypothetical protein
MKLDNSNDIIANSVRLIAGGGLINVADYLGNNPSYADLALKADKTYVYNIHQIDNKLTPSSIC